jgi:hypothetical protein
MTVAIATTTITVLRGTTTDAYGDEADVDTPRYTGIPAALTEQSRRVTTRDDPTPRIVRYSVDAVSSMANPALTADLRLDLRRTT